jgi:hypothetical protein
MKDSDVLVITHAAYVRALDGLCRADDSRWTDLINWKHGKRSLTVIDEALANVIDEYQVKAEDVRRVLSYISSELRSEYPSQVAALETVRSVLETVAQLVADAANPLIDEDQNRSRIVWRGVFDERVSYPAGLSMMPLRNAMAGIRYDSLALHKESTHDRIRISELVDKTLKDVELILSKWSYYAKKGQEHSFNASQLLIPDDLPAPVVLDATAEQNFLWELLEDRADIKSIPGNTRSYANVTLHVARATAVGKNAMIDRGKTRIPRLLSYLEKELGEKRDVFLCVHKKIEHIPIGYAPNFKNFSVGHWGAIDGRNDWKEFDTAVIFGLPFRDHVWATNAFFALQGLQDDDWLKNPTWKTYADVREELQVKQITVSVVQAINRVRCRKVVDEHGNCPHTDVFLVLPKGTRGDRILKAIQREMPNIQHKDWDYDLDGEKARVRRNSSHESLIALMSNRLPGETSLTTVQHELGLSSKGMEKLRAILRNQDHALTKQLQETGVTMVASGYGKGSRSVLLKS